MSSTGTATFATSPRAPHASSASSTFARSADAEKCSDTIRTGPRPSFPRIPPARAPSARRSRSRYAKGSLARSARSAVRRSSATAPAPPSAFDRTVAIACRPTEDARARRPPGDTSRTESRRSSTRSAPCESACFASRSADRMSDAAMTAATFVISFLLDRLLDPHPEVPAPFLRPQEDRLPDLDLAYRLRAPLRGHEADRLRVLDDRREAVARALRLDEEERPPFHLDPPDNHAPRSPLRVDREDLVPGPQFAQVLRLAVRQEYVRVDRTRVHAERPGRDVARLAPLPFDHEQTP